MRRTLAGRTSIIAVLTTVVLSVTGCASSPTPSATSESADSTTTAGGSATATATATTCTSTTTADATGTDTVGAGQRAEGAYSSGDYATALMWAQQAADSGDTRGERILGIIYLDGLCVSKDYPKAASLLQKGHRRR